MVANYFLYQNSIVYLLPSAQQQAETVELEMAEKNFFTGAKMKEPSQCDAETYSIANHFTSARSVTWKGNQELFPPRRKFFHLGFLGWLPREARQAQFCLRETHQEHLQGGDEQH